MTTPMAPTGKPTDPIDCCTLCTEDARLLDSVIEALCNKSHLHLANPDLPTNPDPTSSQARRTQELTKILGLLGRCPDEPAPDDLVKRTMGKVHEAKQRQRFTQQIQSLSGSTPGFRWADMLTTAAMIMIGISLLWPLLAKTRDQARRAACAANLATAGVAIGQYAADSGNALPRSNAKPGTVWWNVGQQQKNPEESVQSNSAHLYLLVRKHYISPNKLACPDNHHAPDQLVDLHDAHDWPSAPAVSYSYQNQYTREPQMLDRMNDMAILADKNPLFVAAANGAPGLTYRDDASPTLASNFHGTTGQNVLTSTGRVTWTKQPVMKNGDNIWMIQGVDRYQGIESPDDMNDAFLVP